MWKDFHASDVYRSDAAGMARCCVRMVAALMFGGSAARHPASLLDNAPLERLLARELDFDAIRRSIDAGALTAVGVTVSGYTSGESISFFQGAEGVEGWRRSRRVGVRTFRGIPARPTRSGLRRCTSPSSTAR